MTQEPIPNDTRDLYPPVIDEPILIHTRGRDFFCPAPTFYASNMKLRTEERMRVYLRISPFSRLLMYGPGRGIDWSLFYRGDAIASGRSRTHAGAVRAMDRLTQKTINRQRYKAQS